MALEKAKIIRVYLDAVSQANGIEAAVADIIESFAPDALTWITDYLPR